jgi:DNA-binding LytR/AlgR family response regulator
MNVIIIEDESGVAQNLVDILGEIDPAIHILGIIESVKDAVTWFGKNPDPELGFFDIRLADGDSFEIFDKTEVNFPVIFTTAYDEYAIKAFKVNSIDYLLKPIDKKSLAAALDKYNAFYRKDTAFDNTLLLKAVEQLRSESMKKFRKNFLVYIKDQILPVSVENIAYFFLESEVAYCVTFKNERFVIDQTLDRICSQIDQEQFYRANRQFIISRKAVKTVVQHFNRKLKINLIPSPKKEVFVSKTKATEFKEWLER